MSGRDDEPAAKPESARRGSIPAPASVPRPSKPPPTNRIASTPPPTTRKGTLVGGASPPSAPPHRTPNSKPPDQKAPAARISTSGNFAFVENTDEDFDPEKTMVVDPDDAPTADYDPRAHAPTPVGGSASARDASAQDAKVSGPPPMNLTEPIIPAAPQAPSFDASGVPSPRQSQRRTSRRTIKIDDQGRAKSDSPSRPADASASIPEPLAAADFSDAEEITIVQALRIISIGSDPPPPITTAIATWPPPARLSFDEDPLESGWTPAAGVVQVKPPVDSSANDAPIIETKMEHGGLDISGPISEIPIAGGDEILEEIEPDAMPFAAPAAQPKRPPPPPPKNRDAKADAKADARVEAKPDAKPQDTRPTTDAPKAKPWWDDIFSDEYIRTHERLDAKSIEREVDFIEESLGMEKHAVVLDLCCGFGDHAVELAGRGYNVVGFDYSKGMLKIAEQKVKSKMKGPSFSPPSLVQGDMRELNYEEAFDGVYCWGTSLGYFDDEKNMAVLQKVHRALRQGGMFLIEVINRDYVAPRSPSLVWFEGRQCVCMDDMYIDFISSRMRVKRTAMFEGGLSRELDYSIRIYTLHELGRMLHDVGFKVIEVTGHTAHPGVFFGTESPRLIILAERS